MKKMYESPVAEKIEFRYADQVVASNGTEGPTMYDFIDCPEDNNGAMGKPNQNPTDCNTGY